MGHSVVSDLIIIFVTESGVHLVTSETGHYYWLWPYGVMTFSCGNPGAQKVYLAE